MIKYFAVSLIAISVSAVGFFASKRMEKRLCKLEKVCVFLSDINSRIRFTADCAADIFSSLTCTGNYSVLPFVSECSDGLSSGEDFDICWERALSKKENISGLKKEDVDVLVSFGSAFGTTDTQGQISNCEMHKKLIEMRIESAQTEIDLYSKPAKGIGVLMGIIVIILSI